uniref:Uncharacterized protein n=1 Tax=Panagrolaimus sp. JU765 TaxID=591449 RepID=A0AC34RJK7_9BILA
MDDLREPENSALWNKVVKLDEPTKKLLMDLQKRWLNEYEANRAKLLCELAQILHNEYVSDQARIRAELRAQFENELETTKPRKNSGVVSVNPRPSIIAAGTRPIAPKNANKATGQLIEGTVDENKAILVLLVDNSALDRFSILYNF